MKDIDIELYRVFSIARDTVEKIISPNNVVDIKEEIKNSTDSIPKELIVKFYGYMSNLFLNVILNRVSGLQNDITEIRALESRAEVHRLFIESQKLNSIGLQHCRLN